METIDLSHLTVVNNYTLSLENKNSLKIILPLGSSLVTSFFKQLKFCTNIVDLDLSNNWIPNIIEISTCFREFINNNTSLKSFQLSNFQSGFQDPQYIYDLILSSISCNVQLEELIISDNYLSDTFCENFKEIISLNTTLLRLNLENCQFSTTGLRYLCEGIRDNRALMSVIIVSNSDITEEILGVSQIGEYVRLRNRYRQTKAAITK